MYISEAIAQHILDVHFGNNWTDVNLRDILSDVTLEEAVALTPASPNTIASILFHISFYNKVVLERLHGNKLEIDETNGFNLPPVNTPEAWEQLKLDNLQSAQELADETRKVVDETLLEPIIEDYASRYKNLHGIAEHVHYHLGQIVMLKKLIRNTKN